MFFCSPLYFPMHRVFSQAEASSQNMVNTDQKGAMKQGAMRQGREASMNTQGIWGSWGRDTEASMWGQVRAPNMHFLARDSLHHGVCEYSKIKYKSRPHLFGCWSPCTPMARPSFSILLKALTSNSGQQPIFQKKDEEKRKDKYQLTLPLHRIMRRQGS